jgi:hypothetical protein
MQEKSTFVQYFWFFFTDNFDSCMKVSLYKKLSAVGFNAEYFYRESTLLYLI